MENLISINLKISQSLTQSQEAILVHSKQLQTIQAQMNSNKQATEKPETHENKSINNSKIYFWTHGSTQNINHTIPTCNQPKDGHQVEATLDNSIGGSDKYCKENVTHI